MGSGFTRSSTVAFAFFVLSLLSCAGLINQGLYMQSLLLQASDISFEQHLLLEQTGNKLHNLLGASGAAAQTVPVQISPIIQQDIRVNLAQVNANQLRLVTLFGRGDQAWLNALFPELPLVQAHLLEVDGVLGQVNHLVADIQPAPLDSPQAIKSVDLLVSHHGKLLSVLAKFNDMLYQHALQKNKVLSVLYGALLVLILCGFCLIWCLLFRPLMRILAKSTEEIAHKDASLAFQALHDTLTLLPGRLAFNQRMQELAGEGRIYCNTCLLLLNVDNFKSINDTFGHPAGDRALVHVANCLRGYLQAHESAYRIAGDEFALILENMTQQDKVDMRVRQLVYAVRNQCTLDGHAITCSVGGAWGEKSGSSLREMFSAAHVALYEVKENGRNHYRFFDQISEVDVGALLKIEQDLHFAVKNRQFVVYYHPITRIVDDQIIGFEALARWQHPEQGLLLPKAWLRTAERLSLLSLITCMVIDQVVEDYYAWKQQGLSPPTININITESMLVSGVVFDYIQPLLEQHGNSRNSRFWLGVEVTESIVFDRSIEPIRKQLELMQKAGVKIALDDFGTGFASLTHLQAVPFDILKLDQAFTSKVLADPNMRVIVKSLIDLAGGIHKEIVCEGVEDEGTKALLLALGCSYMQGYLYSRPLPYAQTTQLLTAQGMA